MIDSILKEIPSLIKEANTIQEPGELLNITSKLSGYLWYMAEELGKRNRHYIECEAQRKDFFNKACLRLSKDESMAKATVIATEEVAGVRASEVDARADLKDLEMLYDALKENIWSLRKRVDNFTTEKITTKQLT